jgi:protein TonB
MADWRKLSTLQIALMISFGLHAALLTVRLVNPQAFDRAFRDTPLQVILVNAKAHEDPAQAQAIAQASLAGGGEVDKGRATSPLAPSPSISIGDANEDSRKRIEQIQQEQQQLLAAIRREVALLPPPDPQQDSGSPKEQQQDERRQQMLKMLAEIEKRINEDNARPKKRYISPATREEVYAIYYDALRRKIEDKGTRDFPEYRGRKLYGELTMNVTIDALGNVVDAEVVQTSGQAILDRRAVAIVKAAAPYGKFNDEMHRQADQIVVTSRFRFTREDGLETSLSSQ